MKMENMVLFTASTKRNLRSCFECGRVGRIHDHHVIPRSLGGTKTVPLCEDCHNKVHGLKMENHGNLIRVALAEARRKGKALGRPVGSTLASSELLAKHSDIVRHLKAGHSVRHTHKITGKATGTVMAVKKAMPHRDPPRTDPTELPLEVLIPPQNVEVSRGDGSATPTTQKS